MSSLKNFFLENPMFFFSTGIFLIAVLGCRVVGIQRIVAFSSRRPWWVIVGSVVLVSGLGLGVSRLQIDADVTAILPETVPSIQANHRIEAQLGSVDRVYFVVEAQNGLIWQPKVLARVKALSEALVAAPWVDRVLSLTEAKDARIVHEDLVVGTMMDQVPMTPAEIQTLRERVRAHLVLGKKLVSEDERSTMISVLLKASSDQGTRYGEAQISALDLAHPDRPTIENLVQRYDGEGVKILVSGLPYIRYDSAKKMSADMVFFLPAGIGLMLAFLFLCFRSLRGMLLPFSVVAASLIGLYGLMGWLGQKLFIPFVIIGPLMIAIAHNYGTQLIASYYEVIRAEPTGQRAPLVNKSVAALGGPVLLSAATVVTGFLSMAGHPLPAMAELGYFSAFGITLAFLLTLVLTPAILGLLPLPPRDQRQETGNWVDQTLRVVAQTTSNHRVAVLVLTAVVVAGCCAAALQVRADSNAMGYYHPDSPVFRAFQTMGRDFSGAMTVNVLLEASPSSEEEEEGPLKKAPAMKWMERFQRYVVTIQDPGTGRPLVGDSASVADQVAYMSSVLQPDGRLNAVPDDSALIAQYLLLIPQEDWSSLVDPSFRTAQIVVQLPEMDSSSLETVVGSMKSWTTANPPPGFTVSFGGSVTSVFEINQLLVRGQIDTLILAVLVIILCYMLVFRSVVAGLFAAIPLVIAIPVVFGLMGLFHIHLDTVTSILTGIMIGAGTDYTAYFLWRMREVAGGGGSLDEAYRLTLATIGKGIVYNGFSVVVGFLVFFGSNFLPVVFFGFLISVSISICILGALTVLPAALLVGNPRFLRRPGPTERTPEKGLEGRDQEKRS